MRLDLPAAGAVSDDGESFGDEQLGDAHAHFADGQEADCREGLG